MPEWDEIFTESGRVFLNPHSDMERISELFGKKKIQRILDLGCGTGRHILFFAKKGFDVYGLDGSPRGIELAREWLTEEGEEAKLDCSRIEHPFPYADKFFDALISIQVIHHNFIADILKTVKEIERVLKKDGIIFITIPYQFEDQPTSDEWQLKKVESRTYIPHAGKEKGIPHHFFSLEEIEKIFNAFEFLEIYIDTTNHRAILGVKK